MTFRPQSPAYPFPIQMDGAANAAFMDEQMSALDDNARFIVRRLIAEAYASGVADGRLLEGQAQWVDRTIAKREADSDKGKSR